MLAPASESIDALVYIYLKWSRLDLGTSALFSEFIQAATNVPLKPTAATYTSK